MIVKVKIKSGVQKHIIVKVSDIPKLVGKGSGIASSLVNIGGLFRRGDTDYAAIRLPR